MRLRQVVLSGCLFCSSGLYVGFEFSSCRVLFVSFSPCMSGQNLVRFWHHDRSSQRASIRFVFRGGRPGMSPRISWFCHLF